MYNSIQFKKQFLSECSLREHKKYISITRRVGKLHALGKLGTMDLEGCNSSILNDLRKMKPLMLRAAKIAGATVVTVDAHRFKPFGLSVTVIISESHLAIHTWPEYGAAALDVFTCGDIKTREAAEYIKQRLGATGKYEERPRCVSAQHRSHKPT